MNRPEIVAVGPRDAEVAALLEALTAELALGGYTDEQSFGYSPEQLETHAVHLVAARYDGGLVGVGGVERQGDGIGELKRFYVAPRYRGSGAAPAILGALVDHAREHGVVRLRLETGDEQLAAIAFYRRHGFVVVPRFGPYVHSATSVCLARDLDQVPQNVR